MHKAQRFGKRMICLLLCTITLAALTVTASAAMVDLEIAQEDRQVSAVHYSANTESVVIGCLEDGAELNVIGQTKAFYKIECGNMTGYIAKEQTVVDDNGHYYVNCSDVFEDSRTMEGRTQEEVEETVEALLEVAEDQLGTRYRWGGTRPGGFDCSGYVMYLYTSMGYEINRTASQQLENGLIVEKEDLQPGDLVFFQGTSSQGAISSHVGIYVGDGKFIHSSSSGVRYDDLESDYYAAHYLCARRIIVTGTMAFPASQLPTSKMNRSSGPVGRGFL